jgi:hypothetical protein
MAAGRGYLIAQVGVLTGDAPGVGLEVGVGLGVRSLFLFPSGVGVARGFGRPGTGLGPWTTLGGGGGGGGGWMTGPL